jgi:hypothetical protein
MRTKIGMGIGMGMGMRSVELVFLNRERRVYEALLGFGRGREMVEMMR